ncbi:MAG: alpha/beta hydrolase [Bacillota bacterium]
MRSVKVVLNSGGLSLEARLELPGNPGPCPGVVLCHPHPLYGGNMDNNVILAVGRALAGAGIASLRFNFRGVGRSWGSFDNGVGEREDARSALDFLTAHEEIHPERIGVMGYSFGGMVALAVAGTDSTVKAVAAVSPVVQSGALRGCVKPKYIVCGAEDSIIPSSAVLQAAAGMADPKRVEVVPGADHFWWGSEDEMAGKVAGFFKEFLV